MNKDNFVDFYLSNADGKDALFLSDGRGGYVRQSDAVTERRGESFAAQMTDYDNGGLLDVVLRTSEGLMMRRGLGNKLADVMAIPLPKIGRASCRERVSSPV